MNLVSLAIVYFIFMGAGSWASASPYTSKILVSVGDLKENNNLQWKKDTCALTHFLANQVSENGIHITCRSFETSQFIDSSLGSLKLDHSYHLRIMRGRDGNIEVDITNWSRRHKTDFTTLGWRFKDEPSSKSKKEDAMAKALANFFFFVSYVDAFKVGLLVNGAAESESIYYDQQRGLFLEKISGLPISSDKAYSLYEEESDRKKNYLRTGIEIGVLLSAGMAIYYQNVASNMVDFDYSLKDGLQKKLNGEAILFDDNSKATNYGHVYAGVLYYQTAQSNGLSSLESFLTGFASSAAWELLEYREVFSINDQIMTPVGGYVLGEASYQISCALLKKGTKLSKVFGYGTNPGLAVNHAMDKYQTGNKYASQPDCKKTRWSEISLYLGLERGQKPYKPSPTQTYVVGMEAEVVNIADFNKPGKSSEFIKKTTKASASIEKMGGDGLGDLKVVAQVVAAAYHQKNLEVNPHGQLHGYEVIFGLGSGTTWTDHGANGDSPHEDFYGTVNVLGATAHADLFYKGFHIQAEFGFYGDFVMVKAWALNDLKERNGGNLDDQTGLLRKRGYYWGLGTSTLAAISIQRGNVVVGYKGQVSEASSINERYRYQNVDTNPAKFEDSYSSHRVFSSLKVTKNFSIQIAREVTPRGGSANGISSQNKSERRTMGTLVYLF